MLQSPPTISITLGTILKTVLVLAAVWLLIELHDIVLVLITAIVIASAIEPAVARLRRWRIPRPLAVLIIYLLLFALIFCIFFFFIPTLFADFASLITLLPSYIERFNEFSAFDQYAQMLGLPAPTLSTEGVLESLRENLGGSGVFNNAFTAIASVFGGVLSFVLIIVFSFYFAVIETGVDDFLSIIAPRKHRAYVQDLWKRSRQKIGLWMQGQLLLAVIIGVLVFLLLTIFGVKHALILAVMAGLFEIIPVFGPTLAAIPAVGISLIDGGLLFGLLIAGVYVLIQQFENHLIYPLVVTRVVGVPPLLVILALIVGAELAGFLGILLSVPTVAVLQEFVKDIQEGKVFAEHTA